jgi:anti-sigma regulatory factor (Ser/Thr protein kinase)
MSAHPARDGFLMHGSWHADVVLTRKFELAGGADAPGIARVEITELLAGRISPSDLLDVTVLVSEVVTNAVRHGRADAHDTVVVHVAMAADLLRIEVCDHGPGFSPPANPRRRSDGGGNGLMMLQRVSSAWGVATDDGTCVWFERPVQRLS